MTLGLDTPSPRSTNLVGPLHMLELQAARPIAKDSLTVILPVTSDTLPGLEAALLFLSDYSSLAEVVVLCPESLLSVGRAILRNTVSDYSRAQFTLQSWPSGTSQAHALIHAASQVSNDHVVILEHGSLREIPHVVRDLLLRATAVSLPVGAMGFGASLLGDGEQCLLASDSPQPASYLVPPLVLPSSLLTDNGRPSDALPKDWRSLGIWIAERRPDMVGGVVVAGHELDDAWCLQKKNDTQDTVYIDDPNVYPALDAYSAHLPDSLLPPSNTSAVQSRGTFGIFFRSFDDLLSFSPAACYLVNSGHVLHILLYLEEKSRSLLDGMEIVTEQCSLQYRVVAPSTSSATSPCELVVSAWLDNFSRPVDVLIALSEEDDYTRLLPRAIKRQRYIDPVLVQLSRLDLPYCDWMGSLTLEEWRNWNKIRLDISVITDNRPASLARLLRSLAEARYFGDDAIRLRVNMEQTADRETLDLVENFQWGRGDVYVHHRIVHGGLLPAVVESWYPSSNHSYGLLLEDDVEVSPLFYAWIKLAILRYRYGEETNKSPNLFGISLYQQKNVELRPAGRQPFNARQLFASAGLAPHSPYLSQIPCSWGAVYFPEHWREFHAYLPARLAHPMDEPIVPDVRSSRWARSWKKYFIELVFLRGYTMLYPNYAAFASLSTNHLEAGAHVKHQPRDIFDKKKAMFSLPLMRLPDENASAVLETGLLDLPGGHLPPWGDLPVLDLHGLLTSEEEIERRGLERRSALFNCSESVRPYDAQELLCVDTLPSVVEISGL
ncbi:hypothetical protein BV25DRAFT_1920166 [Artomyces pyxidatus]|uniref:Uncharacterized protein n=1 Tax=Artomyces pyxidatus TaxID=48021 RepID=A0ACB8SNJ4_9AGAM|nr:hypothetical protein BV25DRAFT_1920166 [Artomyces pyxidatus]